MENRSHVVFIVPDGVGVKNYLYSNVLKHLKETSEITIWSTLPESAFYTIKELHDVTFNYMPLTLHAESKRTRLLREAATYARLKFNTNVTDNTTILKNWRRPKGNTKLLMLYRLAELIGGWANTNYNRILKLETKAKRYWKQHIISTYKKELGAINPTSIFITHQRVNGLMPICIAAKELGIRTSTAIFSWDNLPKARLNVSVDQYLVWSDWMKDEMHLFYKEIEPSRVLVTGTPQFEFYKDQNRLIDRVTFAERYGLNPEAKWICFSGDDELTSPHDPKYLRDIAEYLPDHNSPVQIIFRRCPVDFSDRYDEVLKAFKHKIVSIDPIWYTESEAWVGYYSKFDDIQLQVNLAHHCDLVINLGSTMALDFTTFNKPCLYLNYDTVQDKDWTTTFIYKFQHFRSMEGLQPVGWINDVSEISLKISDALNNNLGKDRKLWLEKLVRHPYEKNSEIIAKTIV
ncbi:MAG: hypothetical protein AAF901_04095 [Bacteroidota bacterium]